MLGKISFFLLFVFWSVNLKAQWTSETNPKNGKSLILGVAPYELLGRRSSLYFYNENGNSTQGVSCSYVYQTNFDGSYLFPYRNDRFFYKGFSGSYYFGKKNIKRNSLFFEAGMHYLFYDKAYVTNEKVGDEVGAVHYLDAQKMGFHFGFQFLKPLNAGESAQFFVHAGFSGSQITRINNGMYYSHLGYNNFPHVPKKETFATFELNLSLGLLFGLSIKKDLNFNR